MNKCLKKIISLTLVLILSFIPCMPLNADYTAQIPVNLSVSVDGSEIGIVRAMDLYYDGNTYVSMRDMAVALSGTSKNYNITVDSNSLTITTGEDYVLLGGENVAFGDESDSNTYSMCYETARNSFTFNGTIRKYATIIIKNAAGQYDSFMNLCEYAFLMDLSVTKKDGVLKVVTSEGFTVDIDGLEEDGMFKMVDSAMVGDATTGEILFASDVDEQVAMASTTKLMTYLVVMDAITREEITLEDEAVISEKAEALSFGQDGVIRLNAGGTATVQDLLAGMLLPSSNECALVLAEHVSGSEQAFVQRMNDTATKIGMSDNTVFYNCNGLPSFTDEAIMSKHQNYTTASDMFILASYILSTYPQVTDITGSRAITVSTLGTTVYNTNPMLYNVPGTVGLKTGTTNRAGACLVTALPVTSPDGTVHMIITAEFGAEDFQMREMITEMLLSYGRQVIMEIEPATSPDNEKSIPETLEGITEMLVNSRRNSTSLDN